MEIADTNQAESLAKYTFALKGLTFMVFGKAARNGKVEAEIEFWRNKLEERITQNLGSVTS